jgi:hypothetical protein
VEPSTRAILRVVKKLDDTTAPVSSPFHSLNNESGVARVAYPPMAAWSSGMLWPTAPGTTLAASLIGRCPNSQHVQRSHDPHLMMTPVSRWFLPDGRRPTSAKSFQWRVDTAVFVRDIFVVPSCPCYYWVAVATQGAALSCSGDLAGLNEGCEALHRL